jgi:hypothetical protein
MAIDFNVFRPKAKMGSHAMYGITPAGQEKLDHMALDGVSLTVADVVRENSPCDVDEIAQKSQITPEKTRIVMKTLIKKGYLQQTNGRD